MLHNFIILNIIEGSKLKIQQLEYKLKIPGVYVSTFVGFTLTNILIY